MFSSSVPKQPIPLTDERRAEINRKKEEALKKSKKHADERAMFWKQLRTDHPEFCEKLDSSNAREDKAKEAIRVVLSGAK